MRTTLVSTSLAFAVLLCAGACNRTATGPSGTLSIVINGPDSVPPGQTVHVSASAVFPDGSARVLTTDVVWTSSDPGLMTVSTAGLVTAGAQRGEAEITAKYIGSLPADQVGVASARKTLFVLPTGTHVVSGSVKDEGNLLSGVDIEVTGGTATGIRATANPSFRLYGIAGETEIRASKVGFETQIRRMLVTENQTEDFDLVPSAPRPNVAGTYTLSVVAGAECAANLPANARARAYTASITQTDALLQMVLSGPGLSNAWGPSDTFGGSVQPSSVQFTVAKYSGAGTPAFSPPAILEFLTAPNIYFTFFGSVVAAANEHGFSGTLDGNIELLALPGPWDGDNGFTWLAICRSKAHQFVLTRQDAGTRSGFGPRR